MLFFVFLSFILFFFFFFLSGQMHLLYQRLWQTPAETLLPTGHQSPAFFQLFAGHQPFPGHFHVESISEFKKMNKDGKNTNIKPQFPFLKLSQNIIKVQKFYQKSNTMKEGKTSSHLEFHFS